MSILSSLNVLPGMGTVNSTTETNFLAAPSGQHHTSQIQIVSTAADAGNTPTTTLRAGLLMGKITASGKYKEYNPTATDGSQIAVGILYSDINTLDAAGVAGDRIANMVVRGIVYSDQLLLLDEQARRQLYGRVVFLDRLGGADPAAPLSTVAKVADYTVVSGTDSGKLFTNAGATGAVVFTLPTTIAKGDRFRFFVEADYAVTIAAPANKLVVVGSATATSIAFSTSSEMIGAGVEIVANAAGTKYLAFITAGETQTPTIA